jgi:phosphoadenosine phosphosulfate reductase
MDAWSEDNSIAKVCPFLEWDEAKMEEYVVTNNLPNETRYFDPTKVLGNRECGLHPSGLSKD